MNDDSMRPCQVEIFEQRDIVLFVIVHYCPYTRPMSTQLTLTGEPATTPYADPARLRNLYHEQGNSLREIADELNCHYTTIHQYMDQHGIERRDANYNPNKAQHAAFTMHTAGYELWVDDSSTLLVHRLVAVAKHGFDAVCDGIIHHENKIKWDNRPENLTLCDSHRQHIRRHHHSNVADDQTQLPAEE